MFWGYQPRKCWGCQPGEGEMAGQEASPQVDTFLGGIKRGLVWEPCF